MERMNLSNATISSMLQVLQDSIRKDSSLAYDLHHFLSERNIHIPPVSKNSTEKSLPVSFDKRNPDEQVDLLKNSFDGMDLNENILS